MVLFIITSPEMHASLKELRTARGTEGFRQDELERCGTLKTGERLDWVCAHLSVLGCRQEPGEMTKRIFGDELLLECCRIVEVERLT